MRRPLCTLLLALSCLIAAPAMADVITPDRGSCDDKRVGASCRIDDAPGICQDGECCTNDGPPATGLTPERSCKPCLVCVLPSEPPADKSSCAAAGPGQLGAWSLLAGVFMLTTLRRRRQRP
jgi:hypothetical protein